MKVSTKLKAIKRLIDLLAKGFLPKDSTLSKEIRPNEENPIMKDAITIINTNKYLKA